MCEEMNVTGTLERARSKVAGRRRGGSATACMTHNPALNTGGHVSCQGLRQSLKLLVFTDSDQILVWVKKLKLPGTSLTRKNCEQYLVLGIKMATDSTKCIVV